MLGNFLKTGIRNLIRQKGFTLINLFGLAVGMAGFIFVLLFVNSEYSYEKFNDKADRIFRVYLDGKLGNQEIKDASTPSPMAAVLMDEYPEVELATRYKNKFKTLITYNNNKFFDEEIRWADSTFFNIFSIPILQGDKNNILNRNNTLVLTRPMAEKIFDQEDPIGKTIQLDDGVDYEIVGVCEKPPEESHIKFSILLSISQNSNEFENHWGSNNMATYVLIKEGSNDEMLESHFPEMVNKYMGPIIQAALGMSMDEFYQQGSRWGYFLEPILGIHLNSETGREGEGIGSGLFVLIIALIGLFILFIACINYINLSTAKAFLRAKEVGIRKVVGAGRSRIILQFLTESIILSFISLGIAILFLEALMPAFNNFTGKELDLSILLQWYMLLCIIGIVILVGILAGGYNAFYITRVKLTSVLKGQKDDIKKRSWIRNGLVVFQFSISIFLIISTVIVFAQVNWLNKKELGFKKDGVLVVESVQVLGDRHEIFKEELKKSPGIINASASITIPGKAFSGNGVTKEGIGTNEVHVLFRLPVDFDYIETMNIKVIEGRSFSREFASDSIAFILNETAIRSLELNDPFNELLFEPGDSINKSIIGIVEDINYNSLHEEIRPMAIELNRGNNYSYISVSFNPGDESQIIEQVRTLWEEFVPDRPFEYFFLDEELNSLYEDEMKLGKLYGIFSMIAIFIACLGLLGLASFSAERRTKEIGIRKVLGAEVLNISSLLIKEFSRWVLLANIFAWPAGYFIMKTWIQNFPSNEGMKIWAFLIGMLISLAIAVITVSYYAFKAARKNPADALQYE